MYHGQTYQIAPEQPLGSALEVETYRRTAVRVDDSDADRNDGRAAQRLFRGKKLPRRSVKLILPPSVNT
jgi:hypothetical protein